MRILRRATLAALVLILIAVVGAYWWQRPMVLTGTGYAAHNACAVGALSGRHDPESDLPPNPLVPVLKTSGDAEHTTGSLLGVLARQQAWYTEGFGCTLTADRPELGEATPVTDAGNPFTDTATPEMSDAVSTAVGRAFGDDLDDAGREQLGTRAILAVKNGELVAERYADGFDASTPQLGWSMSKSATGLMVGMLVEQGEVTLEDDRLRPEWTEDADDPRADITVEDLLRMTSGLAWDETYDLGTPITRMLYLEDDMGAYVAGRDSAHRPGTVQQYSSGSTTLLCSILAQRTGLGADLPRSVLFEQLGLSSAVLEPDAAGTPVCSSYLWATPRDWAALAQFALQNGRWHGEQLLPRDWMRRSLSVEPTDRTDDPGYGLGWRTNVLPDGSLRWPDLPRDAYSANGHDGQIIIVVPSEELVVVRLGFTPELEDQGVPTLTADLIHALP